jgi:hypothetical protein
MVRLRTVDCRLSLLRLLPAWPPLSGARKDAAQLFTRTQDAVYENLRDLNCEYRSGKFPENDYLSMKASLEEEAAAILAEMARLEQAAAS